MSLLHASKTLQSEHTHDGSVLEGRLDVSCRALRGYSMGGGGTQFAALEDPTLKCAISLCPYGGPREPSASVPALIICGEVGKLAASKHHSWKPYKKNALIFAARFCLARTTHVFVRVPYIRYAEQFLGGGVGNRIHEIFDGSRYESRMRNFGFV